MPDSTTYLEYHAGASRKFWRITYADGPSYCVTFGRIGTIGQSQTKTFPTPEAAAVAVRRMIESKLAKGYARANATGVDLDATAAVPKPAPVPASERFLSMLCLSTPESELPALVADRERIFEPKLDGDGVVVQIVSGVVTALGRQGQVVKHNPLFQTGKHAAELARLGMVTLKMDGELIGTTLHVFDLPLAGPVTRGTPWADRHAALVTLFDTWQPDPACFRLVPVASTPAAKSKLVKTQRARGAEGVVVKHQYGLYRNAERHDDCRKVKFTHEADLVVIAVRPNGKDNAHLGAYRNGELVKVGQCSLIGKPIVHVGDVVVVEYLYFMDQLVQPRLRRVRPRDPAAGDHKPASKCTYDQLVGTDKSVAS